MRVVHFTSVHAPTDVRIFERECRALVEDGHTVFLIAPMWDPCGTIENGVYIQAVPRGKSRWYRFTVTAWRVTREALRRKGDVYHFHDMELIPAGIVMSALGKRVIYDAHENLPEQVRNTKALPAWFRPLAARIAGSIERFAARRLAAVVTADPEISQRLRPCNENIITLENFPALENYPGLLAHQSSFRTSGVLANFGGIDTRTCTRKIVEALALLPDDVQTRMVLGGRSTSNSLETEVAKMPGWQRVHYQGRTSRPQMMDQLCNASAALVLFSPAPNHQYVRSNRFFEALAAGTPVITSNFPNWQKMVEQIGCGLTVDPTDPQAIADAIQYLLQHPAEAAEMGRRGQQAVFQRLNWGQQKQALLALYRAIGRRDSERQARLARPARPEANLVPASQTAVTSTSQLVARGKAVHALRFERMEHSPSDWHTFQGRNLCQSPEWLAFLADSQGGEPVMARLVNGGSTAGYFAGMVVSSFGLKILGSPFPGWTTPYMGLNLCSCVSRLDAVKTLVRFAFEDLGCVHMEMMDRHLTIDDVRQLGFAHRVLYGYEIDLSRTEDELFGSMTSACRRCIRKAEKSGITIEEVHQDPTFADEYYEQLKDVFAKQRLVPTYGIERVQKLIQHLEPTGYLLLLRARDPMGRCIATGIFPAITDRRAYFWGMASWREHQILRPNEALLWSAIRYWKTRGMQYFDMGGAGDYKRKYGPHEIEVPWLRVSKYRIIPHLRNAAKNSMELRQRVLGKLAA